MTEPVGTIWVCVDCLMAHCNGEIDPNANPVPLSAVIADYDVTLGMLHEYHAPDCDWTNGECECEREDFSWRPCEGCGSTLGGERHAMTIWTRR